MNYCSFNIEPFCSDVCGDHRRPQTLVEICRNMGICCGFRAVADREKYPGFMLLLMETMGAQSSTEFEWLALKIGHQDYSPRNDQQGDMPCCVPYSSQKNKSLKNYLPLIFKSHIRSWQDLDIEYNASHSGGYSWECINSLWPRDAIWRQRSGSTLAQVIAWCLTAPSHYLNQCWLIIIEVQWHSY